MKQSSTQMSLGALLVALSALGYSTNPILGKFAYQAQANAITLGAIRFTSATLGLWAILFFARIGGALPLIRRLKLMLLGAGGLAIVALLYFTALEQMDASLATGIFYTYPAMVTIVAVFRGERLKATDVAGLAMTLVGTWLLLGTGLGGFSWQGALLILSAAAIYAASMLLSERWSAGVSPFVASAHVTAGAALVYLAIMLISGQPLPNQVQAYASGVGLALLSTMFALITMFAGLARVGPTRASIISTLEPVFTALLALAFLGERLAPVQATGILVVVVGAVVPQLRARKSMQIASD